MRYTKALQKKVYEEIKNGVSPAKCSEDYGIPMPIIIRWAGLDLTEQRAKEIAIRKYQPEVSEAEAEITGTFSAHLSQSISDADYLGICRKVSKSLYSLTADIIRRERRMAPPEEPEADGKRIIEIAEKWRENPFIQKYSLENKNDE